MDGPEEQNHAAPRRHLAAGAALSTIAEVGPFISGGVLSVVLARVIGPSGNGAFALTFTVVGTLVLIFSLGLSAGITYEVSRRRWSAHNALTQTYPLALGLGLVGTAVGLGFYAVTRHGVMHAVSVPVAVIGVASVPALLATQFAASILLGRDRYEGYASMQVTGAAVVLLVAVGLAVPFGLTGAIVGVALASVVTATLGAVLIGRQARAIDNERALHGVRRPLRAALRFGAAAWIANIFQQVNYRFDVLILGAYASAAHVGVYSVALVVTSIAWFLPHGLQTVMFPRTADLDAATEAGELSATESDSAVARGIRHSVVLLVPSGLVVVLLLAVVPLIYGPHFDQTVPLGFVLLPGVLALGVGKVLGSAVAGRGAIRYNLYNSAITAAVTLGLYFLLIPAFGAWGAAAGSSISYFTTTLLCVAFFRRKLGIPLSRVLIPTTTDLRDYLEALTASGAHLRAWRTKWKNERTIRLSR